MQVGGEEQAHIDKAEKVKNGDGWDNHEVDLHS